MSTKLYTIDSRVERCGSFSCAWSGSYKYRNSIGGNDPARSIPQAYTSQITERFDGVEYWESVFGHTGFAGTVSGVWTPPEWTANDQIDLINKLRAVMDGTDFDAGISGAELGRATDTLAERVRQLWWALRQARRGKFKDALDLLGYNSYDLFRKSRRDPAEKQRITDLWLEFQFGLRPLVNDIYNLSETITHFSKQRGKRVVVKIKKSGNYVGASRYDSDEGTGYTVHKITAYLKRDASTLPERMGLTNPAGILWEALPWSFVIDWALPIGDWIAAQSFALRAQGTFVHTTLDVFERRCSGAWGSGYVKPWTFSREDPPGAFFTKQYQMTRTVTDSLSVPLPVLKSSLLGGEPLARLANAFALLVGVKNRYGT